MKHILLACVGTAVIVAAVVSRAAEPPAAENRLTLSLEAEQRAYHVGDPVVVVFTLKNVSERELLIFDGTDLFHSWFHEFEFFDEQGKPISFTGPTDDLHDAALASRRLVPGETLQHKVLLNGWKLAGLGHPYTSIGKEARTFEVQGAYRTFAGFDVKDPLAWKGRVESAPVTITIEP